LPAGAALVRCLLVGLQRAGGLEVAAGPVRPVAGHEGRWEVVTGYEHERVVEAALDAALALARAALRGEAPDAAEAIAGLREEAERCAIGPSTRAILDAAHRRGIPVMRVAEPGSLFQLGWGKHLRRIQATVTGVTSHIAAEIAQDKEMTKALLEAAGLPVPAGHAVRDEEAAVRAASRLGYPVVVKPLDGNQGKGVSTNLRTPEQVRAAFQLAREFRRHVLVERFVSGRDYRVLVVGDQVVAAARRLPAHVVGDGTHSVRELVAIENANPVRGEGHEKPMTRIRLGEAAEQALARQDLGLDDVPAAGRFVALRENANLSTGGSAEDVTDQIHPRVAAACVRAARAVGLDVAGIDVVCDDLARPLEGQHGAIIEVNAAPGIRMHQHPSKGQAHDVGAAIVASLFPPGVPARVPIVAVTGTNGKTTTARLVDHVLRASGLTTGLTTTEGVYVGGQLAQPGDCTGYWSARAVLMDPTVEVAVLETARGGIFKRGLAFDACDVAVVTNISDDHLGQHGAETLDDLARVKGLLVSVARKAVVLNAEDPRVAGMAGWRPAGSEVVYFSLDARLPLLEEHLEAGGRAVYLRSRNGAAMIMVAEGYHHVPLVEVARLPFTIGGLARHNVANALAAAGALLALGHPPAAIAQALQGFRSDAEQNPGRLNLLPVRDFHVLIDYAHNPASYQALAATARAMPHRRLIGVIASPGDRYDEKLREIGRICGEAFDVIIARDRSYDLRGRAPGEAAGLLLEGAASAGRRDLLAWAIPDTREAVDRALDLAEAGDLVVIGAADPAEILGLVLARTGPVEIQAPGDAEPGRRA
jgi:cyanophycin synthetase